MAEILVIAAHADDEALGCGGAIARHAANGDKVEIVLVADGVSSRGSDKGLEARNESADNAAKILGANKPVLLGLPDQRLDTLPLLEITQKLEAEIKRVNPDIIYTHCGCDLNEDHNIVHRAVLTACRPMPGMTLNAIYGFEVLSATAWASVEQDDPFRPVHYVDTKATHKKKMDALKAYDAEMRPFPHNRSYEAADALAVVRGSEAGMEKAEAFSVLRSFVR